jgi:TetR/AcrR family transcriptional regulator, regulator of cefoperazone and chloramphenicol sensitivity
MTNEEASTRQLIIEAVIQCIEKSGIENLTTRQIAETAGTNIASINYHFRTKNALLSEVLAMTSNHMLDDIGEFVQNAEMTFHQILAEVIFYLLEGSLRYPGLTTAHLYSAVVEKRFDAGGARALRSAYELLVSRAILEFPDVEAARVEALLSQIFSSIMFTSLAPDFFILDGIPQIDGRKSCRELAELYTDIFLRAV